MKEKKSKIENELSSLKKKILDLQHQRKLAYKNSVKVSKMKCRVLSVHLIIYSVITIITVNKSLITFYFINIFLRLCKKLEGFLRFKILKICII